MVNSHLSFILFDVGWDDDVKISTGM
jgi:hypothetical protein